jgi:hypothetical protein
LFQRALDSVYFRGIEYNHDKFIIHLQYADDVLVLDDYTSLLHVKRILRWFELASGLRVHFYKISLVGINLDDDFTYCMVNMNFFFLMKGLSSIQVSRSFFGSQPQNSEES